MMDSAAATAEKVHVADRELEELIGRIRFTITVRRFTIAAFAAALMLLRLVAGVTVPEAALIGLVAWFLFTFLLAYWVEGRRQAQQRAGPWAAGPLDQADIWAVPTAGEVSVPVPRYAEQVEEKVDPYRELENLHVTYFVFEMILVTGIVHYLGGAEWLGSILYVFTIFYANMFLPRAKGMLVTVIGSLLFAGLGLLEFSGAIPHQPFFSRGLYQNSAYLLTVLVTLPFGLFPILGFSVSVFSEALQKKSLQMQALYQQLQGYAGELARHKDELEETVANRTRDLQAAYDELKRAHQELQALDELKSSFLANVSHELRTPLTSIRSFSEILLTYPDEDREAQLEFIQIINQESERLTRLINDVLDVAKIEAGKMEWNMTEVRLDEVVREAARAARPLFAEAGLDFEVSIEDGEYVVMADRDRILQVISNLLNNAAKFTPQGKVRLGMRRINDTAEIYVADTGIGIPPESRDRVFDKFYQVSEENRLDGAKTKGTGLGLSICREIVEHHGGMIWVESEVGMGSTFYFTLRLVPGRRAAAEAAATRVPETLEFGARPPAGDGGLVLVVDDEPGIRRSLRYLLEKEGYQVIEAASGREALELCKQRRPDLITMDVLMPDLSGFNVLEELKNRPSTAEIPVVMVSIVEDRDRGEALGASAYLTKPLDFPELSRTVRSLLSRDPRRRKILVVDDDPAVGRSVQTALAHEGYEATYVSGAEEALRAVRRQRPDLIISDLVMPGMNGYELLRALKKEPSTRDIPVLVLTGHPGREGKVTALSMGADRYLTKDEGLAQLLKEIRTLMGQRGRS